MENSLKELKEKIDTLNKLTGKKISFIQEPKFIGSKYNLVANIQIDNKDVGWFLINLKMDNWKKVFIEQLNRAYLNYFNGGQ